MYYTKDGSAIKPRPWHEKAVKMALKGHGATKIAQKLLGRKSQESTVRDFLSKLDLTKSEPVMDRLKVLFWDIETSPSVYATFGIWNQNLGKGGLLRQGGLLSHAWAWNDGQVYSTVLTPEEAIAGDHSRIVHEMWALLDNADVVVSQNGVRFDLRKANAGYLKQLGGYYGALTSGQHMSNDMQRYYTDFMLGKMPIGKAETILRQTPYKHLLDLNIQQNEWSWNKLMQEPDLIRSLSGIVTGKQIGRAHV